MYAADDDDDVFVVDSAILYYRALNFQSIVDGHALEWGGRLFQQKKITPANTDYILF